MSKRKTQIKIGGFSEKGGGWRLTKTLTTTGVKFCAIVGCKEVCEYGWTEDESGCRCDKVGEMQIRLAAYEDIGTPEQCASGVALMQKQEQGLVVEEDKIHQVGQRERQIAR